MATGTINLPPGFVLDNPDHGEINLPAGFVLDAPGQVTPQRPINRVEERIASRPSAMADLIANPTTIKHPLGAALRTLSGAAELYQGVPASIALDLQKGKPGDVFPNLVKLMKGERPAQFGDVFAGAGLPEGAAATAGLYTDLALSPGGAEGMKAVGSAIKTKAWNIAKATPKAIETIKNIPDKLFRGGLTKPEAIRVESEYGSSNGTLAETVKNKLKDAMNFADEMYSKVFKNTPDSKFINVRPAIEESGRRLKRLGLITENGNLTELGKSEIARDSTYGKLLDFYQSADSISGVKRLAGKASLTEGQMIKSMKATRETMVNKDQYLFLRDKLNSLYKNKPSDMDVRKVVDTFYQSGEDSGLKGLQEARKLEREAFFKADKFLDNRGDLRIATEGKLNRIGTDKPLSKAEMAHIEELQKYVKHPIIKDAESINKLNQAKLSLQRKKDMAIGAGIGYGISKLGGNGGAAKQLSGY